MIINFRDLEVYQESFELQNEIEVIIKDFPQSERFLLSDQMRRCCRAIPAIIAEGWGKRESVKEFQKYLRDAISEANEMINHILVSEHKKYVSKEKTTELIQRYERLIKKLTNLKNNWQIFK